ncbi:hypothetical protein SpiGrapes_1378 [Sphaerochaeta pleomorpha str. Grapes]|uniref:Uncharacterized protein n=1 Tax=Sphaerochaeta pleomorpha (strain ATCC BAA-1885 / DSM 22778 / Grapes) TaxID=158190 RepID=G8QUF7_SPHPG|nr:hypothetical protein [Sphaerochaeta pleomorpha]AEV29190.1 hypothetical protein SpiGrapes_1378 [Sphaerochaeta pleomorpha str. Grapes]
MKRLFAIIVSIAILCSLSLFAADGTATTSSAKLTISATIQEESNIKITDATHSSIDRKDFDSVTPFTKYVILGSGKTGVIAYVHVKTNKHSNFTITMTATPLTSENNSAKIDYTVYLDEGTNDVTFTTNASSNTNNVLTDGYGNGHGNDNGNGNGWGHLKVFSYPLAIDLEDTSYEAALEDTYSGTVTFNYASI